MNQRLINLARLAEMEHEFAALFAELESDIFNDWVKAKDQNSREELWLRKLNLEALRTMIRGKIDQYKADPLARDISYIKGG